MGKIPDHAKRRLYKEKSKDGSSPFTKAMVFFIDVDFP